MKKIRAVFRFVIFVVSTLAVYSFWWLTHFFIPNKQFWRQYIFWRWSKNFAWISGMKIEIIGTAPKPPFFLVCNHLGYVDIPALRLAANGIFVAKSDIESWFMAGPIIRNMGMVFIDRQNRRDIPRAGLHIIEKLNEGEGVMLFPEGTSTKGEEILPFNSSFLEFAAKTDLPVSYAAISYRTPEGAPPPSESICWWTDITFIDHLLRLFSLKEFTATVNFGDQPIQAPNRKELAAELHRKVKEKFIPVL